MHKLKGCTKDINSLSAWVTAVLTLLYSILTPQRSEDPN